MRGRAAAGVAAALLLAGPGSAGPADVVAVEVAREAGDSYRFTVTVRHGDTGWDHYADRWEVLSPAGDVLGARILHHPHVGEQPFTRSLGGVRVPAGVSGVTVRAHDSVHGHGGRGARVPIPR